MANQGREIKSRINSVKNTGKVTKAMEMVSASKMKKAQSRMAAAVPYADGLYEIVRRIGVVKDYKHPLMEKRDEINSVAVIVIGPDRGFVGGLISNLLIEGDRFADNIRKGVNAEILGISLHRKGLDIVNNLGLKSLYHFSEYKDNPTTSDLTAIVRSIVDGYTTKRFDEVYILYTHFINTLVQKPAIKKLLPISFDNLEAREEEIEKNEISYEFEPSVNEVLDMLIPEYFENQLYASILDSIASEHSARMVTMKNATDNAKDLGKELQLKYNKSRQAAITQEIIEVVSGASLN